MNSKSAVAGCFHESPLNYQQFHLRELRTIQGGRKPLSLDQTSSFWPYDTTKKSMQFNLKNPAYLLKSFHAQFILIFDLVHYMTQHNSCIIQNLAEKAWD